MRGIILGIGSSGTSFYTQLANRMGWTAPAPYKSGMHFNTFETRRSREINEGLLGKSFVYDPELAIAEPTDELRRSAAAFVDDMDQKYEQWLFKDPRSTVTYAKLWSRFAWDRIICIYRRPLETLASLSAHHVAKKNSTKDLTATWRIWSRIMLSVPDAEFIRFPGDERRFARMLGAALPPDTGLDAAKITRRDDRIPDWAKQTWFELEARRGG